MKFWYVVLAIVPPGQCIGNARDHAFLVRAHDRDMARCLVADAAREIPGFPAGFGTCQEYPSEFQNGLGGVTRVGC